MEQTPTTIVSGRTQAQYRSIEIDGRPGAGANRLMSKEYQPFGASLRTLFAPPDRAADFDIVV